MTILGQVFINNSRFYTYSNMQSAYDHAQVGGSVWDWDHFEFLADIFNNQSTF